MEQTSFAVLLVAAPVQSAPAAAPAATTLRGGAQEPLLLAGSFDVRRS